MGKIIIPKKTRKNPMTPTYQMLADVINNYEPERLCTNTVNSFKFMLKSEVFAPVHDAIREKLKEIAELFLKRYEEHVRTNLEGKPLNKPKSGPRKDSRKKKKSSANAGNLPNDPSLSMEFRINKDTGLLLPVKK